MKVKLERLKAHAHAHAHTHTHTSQLTTHNSQLAIVAVEVFVRSRQKALLQWRRARLRCARTPAPAEERDCCPADDTEPDADPYTDPPLGARAQP